MAVGKSRRIVIDVDDVIIKRRLHAALAQDGLSLKDWFVSAVGEFLRSREASNQLELPALRAAEPVAPYGALSKEKP